MAKKKKNLTYKTNYTWDNMATFLIANNNTIRYCGLILLILSFIYFIVDTIINKNIRIQSYCLPFIVSFVFSLMDYLCSNTPYKYSKLINNNKELTEIIEFRDNKITIRNADTEKEREFSYEDVIKVFETEKVIVITFCKHESFPIIKEDNNKNYQELKETIINKCQQIKKIQNIHPVSKKVFSITAILLACFFGLIIYITRYH